MGTYSNYLMCENQVSLLRATGCQEGVAIGVDEIGFATYTCLTGVTVNASGICTANGFTSGDGWARVQVEPETCQFKYSLVRGKYGNKTFTHTVTGSVAGLDDATRLFFELNGGTLVHMYVKLTMGITLILGVFDVDTPDAGGAMKFTKLEGDSGLEATEDALAGFSFEVSGKGKRAPLKVSSYSSVITPKVLAA